MIRALALATLATLASACVVDDRNILVAGPTLHACEDAARRVSEVQACDFTGVCALDVPVAECCSELVACVHGVLSVNLYCDDGCMPACTTDAQCTPGAAFCNGMVCEACPEPNTCAACPMGTTQLERNGCLTCDCGPPSQCDRATGMVCDPGGMQICYPGQRCGVGCQAGEAGCCLDVCGLPGCASPAPLGCDTPCPVELGCAECQAVACRCDGMAWTCDAVCAPTTGACFFPG